MTVAQTDSWRAENSAVRSAVLSAASMEQSWAEY